jgi:hypothetical protein
MGSSIEKYASASTTSGPSPAKAREFPIVEAGGLPTISRSRKKRI